MAQPTAPADQTPPRPPTLSHAFAKSTTLTAAAAVVYLTIFALGTGDLASAAVLTAGSAAAVYTIYPTNEYLWDYYYPARTATTENGPFDVAASLWRNTAKYVTWKAGITAAKFGWIYAYTGSFMSMLALGGTTSLALPAVFYVNNVTWDWYDWLQRQSNQVTQR